MQFFSPMLFSIFGTFLFVCLFKSLRTASLHVYSLYIVGIVVRSPGDPLHWLLTAINQSLPTRIESFLKWTMIFGVILLMEEILHQLIGCLSHYLQVFIHRGAWFLPWTVSLEHATTLTKHHTFTTSSPSKLFVALQKIRQENTHVCV